MSAIISILGACLSSALESNVLPDALLRASGFEARSEKTRQARGHDANEFRTSTHTSYSGIREQTRLKLELYQFSTAQSSETINARISPTGFAGMTDNAPSGMPIGTDCRHSMANGRAFLFVTTRFETVQGTFAPPAGVDAKGFFKPAEHDWTADRPLFERIVRHTLARAAGQRLGGSGNTAIAGATVPGAMCQHSGQLFGKMSSWCAATGWTVSSEESYGSFTLRKGGHYAVVPIGANALKVDGIWKKLPDVCAILDGALYLPKTAFEQLAP